MYNKILNLLHRFDRVCPFIQMLVNAIALVLTQIDTKLSEVYLNFFFTSLTLDGVEYFENLLKITPTQSQTLDDRRSVIRAKWLSKNHSSIGLIQIVCDAWKNGEVVADFAGGKLQIKFVGEYGVPEDLNALTSAINEIKPAHIPFVLLYKYLLIKDIHQVKTIAQMELIKINNFAFGTED